MEQSELAKMPLSCAAYGCTNHNQMEKKFSSFRFPNNNLERRERWINACKRVNKDESPWNPTSKNVYLCGEHFISKYPSKDPEHPDYIPTIFIYNKSTNLQSTSKLKRYESARKRAILSLPPFSFADPEPSEISHEIDEASSSFNIQEDS